METVFLLKDRQRQGYTTCAVRNWIMKQKCTIFLFTKNSLYVKKILVWHHLAGPQNGGYRDIIIKGSSYTAVCVYAVVNIIKVYILERKLFLRSS